MLATLPPLQPALSWPLIATLDLGSQPAAVPCARLYTIYMLGEWAHLDRLAGDAALIVSELVTNAVRHGQGQVTLRLAADSRSLLAEIWDALPTFPQPPTLPVDAEGGHGLAIVAALSRDWGWRRQSGGKTVWALMS